MFNKKKKQIERLSRANIVINTMIKLAIEEIICDDPAGAISTTQYNETFDKFYQVAMGVIAPPMCGNCSSYRDKVEYQKTHGGMTDDRHGICATKSEFINKDFSACDDHRFSEEATK